MARKQKDIGDYNYIITEYFNNKDNKPFSKAGLNLALDIDRRNIYDWRQSKSKNKKEFITAYDTACNRIAKDYFKKLLKYPQYQWQYLRTCHSEQFDDLVENKNVEVANNNINIVLPAIRELNNDSN